MLELDLTNKKWKKTISSLYDLGDKFTDYLKQKKNPFLVFVPLRGAYPVYMAILKMLDIKLAEKKISEKDLKKMKVVFLPASQSQYLLSDKIFEDLHSTLTKRRLTKPTDIAYIDTYIGGTSILFHLPNVAEIVEKTTGRKPAVNIFFAGIIEPVTNQQYRPIRKVVSDLKKGSYVPNIKEYYGLPVHDIWEDRVPDIGIQIGTTGDKNVHNIKDLKAIIVPYGGKFDKKFAAAQLGEHGKLPVDIDKGNELITFGDRHMLKAIIRDIETLHYQKKMKKI